MGPEANVEKNLLSGSQQLLKPSESMGGMSCTSCSRQSNVSIYGTRPLLFLRRWAFSRFFYLPTKEVGEHLPIKTTTVKNARKLFRKIFKMKKEALSMFFLCSSFLKQFVHLRELLTGTSRVRGR